MEKSRVNQIIDRLIDSVENGQGVPLSTGKVMVNKDETILMLKQLESIVNNELRVYREVNDRKGKIITEAKKEAEDIIYEAEQTASRIRVTKRVSSLGGTFRADRLDNEERMALRTATDIYAASLIYTDEMLTEVNDLLAQAYDYVNNQYGRMIIDLEEKAKIIADNKAELMVNLKELSKEERYEQILELAQLLSNELYSERQKLKEMEAFERKKEQAARLAEELRAKRASTEQSGNEKAGNEEAESGEKEVKKSSAGETESQNAETEKKSTENDEEQTPQEKGKHEIPLSEAELAFMKKAAEQKEVGKIYEI